jgi:two-component system phosphate regulon sensor histidine kinase PhoR
MSQKGFSFPKLSLARILMIAAILLIVAFQAYWLNRLYHDERNGLAKETNNIFRETVYNLQIDRLKNDSVFYHSFKSDLFVYNAMNVVRNKVSERRRDSLRAVRSKDTATKMIIIGDAEKMMRDTGNKRPRIIIRSTDGNIPPEIMQEMVRKQLEEAKARNSDSATWKQVTRDGSGMGMTMVFKKRPDLPNDSSSKAGRKDVLIERRFEPRNDRSPGAASLSLRVTGDHPEKAFVRMINDGKLISDTLSLKKLDSAYHKELAKNSITLDFKIKTGKDDSLHRGDTATTYTFTTRPATVGIVNPHWYQAEFESPTRFILGKITPQILFSIFLVAFTTAAFIFLYRNLAAQRRLTEIKNDFISNITHELKTPIATVSVAVEALRNFGGIQSPERTKEYLDISASELQRLSLLVDKVLKLSLFENRELDLKKEPVDLKELLQEVLNTMKLQFEKMHASLQLEIRGNYFQVSGDRLHITSVIYNLLDNALKYSKNKPDITVHLQHDTDYVVLAVTDKGIGIPAGFTGKIFEKFFRVPTGDHHNIKGYGLGLSYVAHVVQKHGGTIGVESEPGKGSTFTVKLPIA